MLISSLRRRFGDKWMFLTVIDDSSVEERRDPSLSLANGRSDSNRSLHCRTQCPTDRQRKESFVLRLLSIPENISSVDVETAPLTAITQSDGNTDQCSGKELDGHKVWERREFRSIRSSPRGSLNASWCRTTRYISHVLPPILTVEDTLVRTSCRSTAEEVLREFERYSECSDTLGRLSFDFERDCRRLIEESLHSHFSDEMSDDTARTNAPRDPQSGLND